MSAHRTLALAGVWCALALFPRIGTAQLAAFPVQDLAFGQIPAGVPEVVLPTDAARRAQLDLTGRGNYTVTITLPAQMTSLAGSILPLVFTATDGLAVRRGRQVVFDPSLPIDLRLIRNSTTSVYVGATASPAGGQPPGNYSATITFMIAPAGT